MGDDVCVICTEPDKLSFVNPSSKLNLIEKCKLIKRQDVLDRICKADEKNLPIQLHNPCRVGIYNKARSGDARKEECEIPAKQRRQAEHRKKEQTFEWKTKCFLCTKPCVTDSKFNRKEHKWCRCEIVETKDGKVIPDATKNKILEALKDKMDEKSMGIKARLLSCHDLPAEEAFYHVLCKTQLDLEKMKSPPSGKKRGRPKNEIQEKLFKQLCD